jgi:hypothetical protein
VEELAGCATEAELEAFIKSQSLAHLDTFVRLGRAEGKPFDELYKALRQSAGNLGLSNSEVVTAGLGLSHAINSISSLNFGASYGLQVNQDDPAAPDINRADFSAVYSRNITATVFANLGYQFRWRDEDDSATSNAVFVTLGRSFETRF